MTAPITRFCSSCGCSVVTLRHDNCQWCGSPTIDHRDVLDRALAITLLMHHGGNCLTVPRFVGLDGRCFVCH
jgi:hypothetical protein